jgi:hypothetical protein
VAIAARLAANKSNQNEHKLHTTFPSATAATFGYGIWNLQKITVAYRDFLDVAPFINITTAHSPSRIGLSPS